MRAEKEMCFALTEPEAGSDATKIRTRAEQKKGVDGAVLHRDDGEPLRLEPGQDLATSPRRTMSGLSRSRVRDMGQTLLIDPSAQLVHPSSDVAPARVPT